MKLLEKISTLTKCSRNSTNLSELLRNKWMNSSGFARSTWGMFDPSSMFWNKDNILYKEDKSSGCGLTWWSLYTYKDFILRPRTWVSKHKLELQVVKPRAPVWRNKSFKPRTWAMKHKFQSTNHRTSHVYIFEHTNMLNNFVLCRSFQMCAPTSLISI